MTSGPTSGRRSTPARWTTSGVVAVAVTTVIALALLIVSTSGPVRVWSDPPPGRPSEPVEIVEEQQAAAAVVEVGDDAPSDQDDPWFMRIAALVVGVLVLRMLWMALVGWWTILRTLRWNRSRRERTPDFSVLPSLGPLPSVELDEDAQVAALRTGAPRNAIVACWMRLEDDVAAAGLAPHPSETSAELTERVLAAALADSSAVVELAERYREARFSRHPIGERERELALAALTRIHASLRSAPAVSDAAPAATGARTEESST